MFATMLKIVGKKLLKKYWKYLLVIPIIPIVVLYSYATVQYGFWYKYDCKKQMELYEYDVNDTREGTKCNEEKEVLTYEVVEEKDVIKIGEEIRAAREAAMGPELIDPHAIDFLKDFEIKDKALHNPGDRYRWLTPAQADGFYNTPPKNAGGGGSSSGVAGSKSTYRGGSSSANGPRVYNPSNTKDTYWQWAQDVSAQTGWHPLFIMAQWTQEIGADFHSNNFEKNNNMGGQTWHEGLPESMKGTARPRNEGRYYIRYDDAVDGYIDFIQNNSRYKNVARYNTPEQQAAEVARQGWAVDPNYLSALTTLIEQYRKQYGDPGIVNASTAATIRTATPVASIQNSAGEIEEPEASEGETGDRIVEIAMRYYNEMGKGQGTTSKQVRYLLGGDRLYQGGAADCSDFSQAVYKEAGIAIGGYTVAQMYESGGEFVDGIENLAPGDLVFFHNPNADGHGYANEYNGRSYRISHVGIYIGDGKIVHLSFANDTIAVDGITSGKLKENFVAGKRWLSPGTSSYQPDFEEGDINEAEIHLRGLDQSDIHALEALDLDEELLESEEYADTKVGKTWKVAKLIKEKGEADVSPYDVIYERSEEAEEKDDAQSWLDRNMNWLLYVQYEAYKCYMVGDEDNPWYKRWFNAVFGLGEYPCKTLDKLYEEAGGTGPFIIEEERNQVEQQHVIIEDRWECMDKDSPDGPDPKAAREWHKNKYIPPGDKPDCGAEMKAVNVRSYQSYNTYQRLIEILFDFEPYAMHELDKTVDKKDLKYPDLIKFIVGGVYDEMTDGGFAILPSNDWIIPMELGTYNFSSGFGMRTLNGETRGHMGIDLGTQGVQRVPVYASAAGQVISVGRNTSGYGSVVTIDHKNGFYSMYAHFWLDDIVVKEGQIVEQAQLLGGAGNDMNGDAWHLHFEICKDVYNGDGGVKLCKAHEDPQKYVSGLSTNQSAEQSNKRANQFTGAKDYSGADEKWNQMKARAGSEVILMPGYTKKAGNEKGGGYLGDWVKEGESGNKGPSAYWDDPVGGNSLGVYQLTERTSEGGKGSLYPFGDFVQRKYPDYYQKLSPYDPTSSGFVNRWIALAGEDPIGFSDVQHEYVKNSHYDPVHNRIVKEVGFDPNERSRGVREAIWSGAVQLPAKVPGHLKEAINGKDINTMSDAELIQRYYDVKIKLVPQNFVSSSQKTQQSIIDRYKKERTKILSEMSKCGC